MTATYNPALLTDLDRVRFYVGDRNITAAYFQDEEINAILTLNASYASPFNVYMTVAMLLRTRAGEVTQGVQRLKLDTLDKTMFSPADLLLAAVRYEALAGFADGNWSRVEATNQELPRFPIW